MKKIVYMLDGALCIASLSEGARLAFDITLEDGSVITNRVVVKREVEIVTPASATLNEDGFPVVPASSRTEPAEYEDRALPVDQFMRRWPVAGATARWAETEDAFYTRISARVVPAGAQDVRLIEADDIPTDRSTRATWRLGPLGIITG